MNEVVGKALDGITRGVSRAAQQSKRRAQQGSVALASTVVARSLTQLRRLEDFLTRAQKPDGAQKPDDAPMESAVVKAASAAPAVPVVIPPAPDPEPELTARPSERPPVDPDDYDAIAPEDLGTDWLSIATEAPARAALDADLIDNLVIDEGDAAAVIGEHSVEASKPASEPEFSARRA